MSTFTTYDGSELTATVLGASTEPVVVLPGGPLQKPRYLGNLAGLDAHRELVVLDLPHRRVDQIVGDLEALREHLGVETMDVLSHSAGTSLALLYAAAHPDRIRKLALITPSCRAVGIPPTPEEYVAVLEQRAHEPWYAEARAAMDAWDEGTETPEQRLMAKALVYGRWDDVARAHAASEDADATPGAHSIYYAEGCFDDEGTRSALAKVSADVLVLVGGADPVTPVRLGMELADLFPHAEAIVQAGAGHLPWLDDPAWFVATLSRFLAVP
ncbi:MAG TPA: alpha/beta hydrolase [Jatrophihabitantaceae bacterium]|jgi:pimeloyl-ACP methyl ester carboxylesterase